VVKIERFIYVWVYIGHMTEPKRVLRYSGTRNDNISCIVNRNGKFYYDKSLQPEKQYEELFYTSDIKEATLHASISAMKREDSKPIILEGIIDKASSNGRTTREPFELYRIWEIKPHFNWKAINPYAVFGLSTYFNKYKVNQYLNKHEWDKFCKVLQPFFMTESS